MKSIAFAIVFLSFLTACAPEEVMVDRKNCEQLKEGMSLAEVIAVMGEPKSQERSDEPGLVLYYSEGYLAPGPVTIRLIGTDEDLQVDRTLCQGPP